MRPQKLWSNRGMQRPASHRPTSSNTWRGSFTVKIGPSGSVHRNSGRSNRKKHTSDQSVRTGVPGPHKSINGRTPHPPKRCLNQWRNHVQVYGTMLISDPHIKLFVFFSEFLFQIHISDFLLGKGHPSLMDRCASDRSM